MLDMEDGFAVLLERVSGIYRDVLVGVCAVARNSRRVDQFIGEPRGSTVRAGLEQDAQCYDQEPCNVEKCFFHFEKKY